MLTCGRLFKPNVAVDLHTRKRAYPVDNELDSLERMRGRWESEILSYSLQFGLPYNIDISEQLIFHRRSPLFSFRSRGHPPAVPRPGRAAGVVGRPLGGVDGGAAGSGDPRHDGRTEEKADGNE